MAVAQQHLQRPPDRPHERADHRGRLDLVERIGKRGVQPGRDLCLSIELTLKTPTPHGRNRPHEPQPQRCDGADEIAAGVTEFLQGTKQDLRRPLVRPALVDAVSAARTRASASGNSTSSLLAK
jgi:hypothetical protein